MSRTYAEQIVKNLENLKMVAIFHPRLALVGVLSEIENVIREIHPLLEQMTAQVREKVQRERHPDTRAIQTEIRKYSNREDLFPQRVREFLSYVYDRGGELRHKRTSVLGGEVREAIKNAVNFVNVLQTQKYPGHCPNGHSFMFPACMALERPLGVYPFKCPKCDCVVFRLDTSNADELPEFDALLGLSKRELTRLRSAVATVDATGYLAGERISRPPIVVLGGLAGPGKHLFVDTILQVRSKRASATASRIGACRVEIGTRHIVLLYAPSDEPSANLPLYVTVADIMLLVVGVNEGVTEQTLRDIGYSRQAKIPIIVAVNGVDQAGAQPELAKQQLADHGLKPEEWGGDTVVVELSGKIPAKLDRLWDAIQLIADLLELKADPKRPASGTVLDVQLIHKKGAVASLLVEDGILKRGDTWPGYCKVDIMSDEWGSHMEEAPPGSLVDVAGLESVPEQGDKFHTIQVVRAKA